MKRHGWRIDTCNICKTPVERDQWAWATREDPPVHYTCKFPGEDPGPLPEREAAPSHYEVEEMIHALRHAPLLPLRIPPLDIVPTRRFWVMLATETVAMFLAAYAGVHAALAGW